MPQEHYLPWRPKTRGERPIGLTCVCFSICCLFHCCLTGDPECQSVLTVLSVCDRVEILAQRYYYCNVVV